MAKTGSGKILKVAAIALAVVVVVFFVTSFFLDKHALDETFARVERSYPSTLPTEEYAKDYNGQAVEFTFQGATLRGYVYKADNPKGFIVFRHGITSQHADYLELICDMVDRGWTVFAYDAIGCGISDGDYVKGMAQSPLDVAAAVGFARDSGLVGDLPLVLWGHSWGGYGVAAALDIVSGVDACVTMSGYNSPVGVLMEFARRSMGPFALTQYPTMWLNNKLAFGADADRTALDGINKANTPVLIVHGANDAVVEFGGSAIIAQRERITNPSVEYLVMDEPGRDGHNSYFYTAAANAYLAEKSAELAALEEEYPDGIPEDVAARFMEGVDMRRANEADPALIDAIDAFLTKAVGGDDMMKPEQRAYGALLEAKYSRSGNSLGNVYWVEALRGEDGSSIVRVSESPQHDIPCDIREYRAPDDILRQIDEVADRVGMKEWGALPLTELIAYDAPTTSLNLTYASADPTDRFPVWLSVSDSYELPKGGEGVMTEIRDLMLSYATDENLMREYKEELRQ